MRRIWAGLKLIGRWLGPILIALAVYLFIIPPTPFGDVSATVAFLGGVVTAIAALLARGSDHRKRRKWLAFGAMCGLAYFGWSTWESKQGFHTENVSFDNQGARLTGTLYLPDRPNKVPGIVLVHGSGPAPRFINSPIAQHLAQAGYAVLSYDKRGIGDSTGHYGGGTDREICPENFNLLASDASAGMKLLANRPEVRADAIGLFGQSQAGWIVPRVAVLNGKAAFMVLLVGPTTSAQAIVRHEKVRLGLDHTAGHASSLADMLVLFGKGGRDVPEGYTADQAYALAQTKKIAFPCADFDPVIDLGALNIPGLWVLGKEDWIVPYGVTTQSLERLRQLGKPYQYRLIPGAGHTLSGGPKGMVWDTIDTWLARETATKLH